MVKQTNLRALATCSPPARALSRASIRAIAANSPPLAGHATRRFGGQRAVLAVELAGESEDVGRGLAYLAGQLKDPSTS